jgi:hypothetical protein
LVVFFRLSTALDEEIFKAGIMLKTTLKMKDSYERCNDMKPGE